MTAPPPPSPAPELAAVPGYFSGVQVDRGRASFGQSCVECHAPSEFRGADFEWRWRRQTAWQLFNEIAATMPESRPGSLPAATYVDIVAYLLSLNEYQAGSQELQATREALEAIPLGAGAAKTPSPE